MVIIAKVKYETCKVCESSENLLLLTVCTLAIKIDSNFKKLPHPVLVLRTVLCISLVLGALMFPRMSREMSFKAPGTRLVIHVNVDRSVYIPA